MTVGLVDNTCLYEVVRTLSYRSPEECPRWAWKSAVETTCLIVGSQHLRLAPSPTKDGAASGSFGKVLAGLADVLGTVESTAEVQSAARTNTKRWARGQSVNIRETYHTLMTQDSDFDQWLEWFIGKVWEEHSKRLGGLFDPAFIPQISAIIEISNLDAHKLWEISTDTRIVKELAERQPDSEVFHALRDAYVVSALLRGRYHDNVARKSGWQIMHHPLRNQVLPRVLARERREYQISSPESYLANIIVASAFSLRRSSRLELWTSNVISARRAWRAGAVDLYPKNNDDLALKAAVRAAREVDIRCHAEMLDRILDIAASLGVGALTSVTLSSWEALVASAATASASAFVLRNRDPSRHVISRIAQRSQRLQDLAKAGPGRIDRAWEGRSHLG